MEYYHFTFLSITSGGLPSGICTLTGCGGSSSSYCKLNSPAGSTVFDRGRSEGLLRALSGLRACGVGRYLEVLDVVVVSEPSTLVFSQSNGSLCFIPRLFNAVSQH